MNEMKNSKCSCMGFFKCGKNTQRKDYSAAANQVKPGSQDSDQGPGRNGRRQNAPGSRSQDGTSSRQLSQRQAQNVQNNQQRRTNNRNQEFEIIPNNIQLIQQAQQQQPQKPKKVSNVNVETKYKLEDIECCDFLPQEREIRYQFKYYCPICLRYFNQMLLSQCCQNYLCHFCADEIIERERTVEEFKAQCPYKCEGKFFLKDVTPNMQVKRYSDSQYMSFYSNNLGKNTFQGRFNKENMSPTPGGAGTLTDEGFGKLQKFQQSANQFARNQDLISIEPIQEESKNQMYRSDAMPQHNVPRNPLQQIRQNVIREANQRQNYNNDDENQPYQDYFDPNEYRFQSPQMIQQFGQNLDGLSAIQQNNNERLLSIASSVGPFGPHNINDQESDYRILSQGFELQAQQNRNNLINIQNGFSPQQISQDHDDLDSESEDDDLSRAR